MRQIGGNKYWKTRLGVQFSLQIRASMRRLHWKRWLGGRRVELESEGSGAGEHRGAVAVREDTAGGGAEGGHGRRRCKVHAGRRRRQAEAEAKLGMGMVAPAGNDELGLWVGLAH